MNTNIITYILKKTMIYIGWVLGIMTVYGLITLVGGIDPGLTVGNLVMAAALLAYPAYCVMRSTVQLVLLYFDEDEDADRARAFAGLFHALMPEALEGRPHRVFIINMVSKFLQILLIVSIFYSFMSGDYSMLRLTWGLMFLIAGGFAVLFARATIKDYSRRAQLQMQELEEIRGSRGGMKIDPERRREFMKKPLGLMGGNIAIALMGIIFLWNSQMIGIPLLLRLFRYMEVIGCVSLFLLPVTVSYMIREDHRGTMYTLKIGKGDYGQDKIDFFVYSGKGEDMNDDRYIIDRVDQIETGPRYIRVVRRASVKHVRIPRTMSQEDERALLKLLEEMTDEGRPGAIDRKSEEIRRNMDEPI